MASPRIKSFDQYLGEALATFLSETGVNDISRTSIMLAFLKANAQLASRANGDILQVLRDQSVDRESGDVLRKTAFDENVRVATAKASSDTVTVSDSSFNKISTKIYSGAAAPNANTTVLKVSDASAFPGTGSVYIGRGTNNVEGPIPYLSATPVGGYWEITLSSPTTRFHNISETVILAQGGNRTIDQGTVVKAPSSGGSPDITFEVEELAILQDGEDSISGVRVVCQQVGTIGNVPRGAIRAFNAAPFTSAVVTNESPFTNGRDAETDESLRARIKLARLARGLGVESAIKSAVQGAQAPDEAAIANSVQIVRTPDKTTVFVDDNTGYERKTNGVGLEVIVDNAIGGERIFSLSRGGRTTGVAKAFLESGNSQPFAIYENNRLAVLVGGQLSEHTFAATDFRSVGAATAYEIVSSINANPSLTFSAATADGGQKVVIFAKAESEEYIQIEIPSVGTDANDALLFPSDEVETIRLFLNGEPLSKDGRSATVTSENQVNWAPSITTGATLILSVDGTDFATYTFVDQDFVNEGTFATVSPLNSLQSWANVINARVTGVTAQVVGQGLQLTSNLGENDRSSIEVSESSSLVTDGMFTPSKGLADQGQASDFQFSRFSGQVKLTTPLSAGDRLTAGIDSNEGSLASDQILGGTVTIPNDGYMWIIHDDQSAQIISHGVADSTLLSVSKPSANIVRYTSNVATAFANVLVGDYLIVYSEELSSSNRLEGRVFAKTNTTLDVRVTATEYAAATVESNIGFSRGFVITRTLQTPQKIKVVAGTYNIYDLADQLNDQVSGYRFLADNDTFFIAKTINMESGSGDILLVAFDENVDNLSLTAGTHNTTKIGSTALAQSVGSTVSLPAFVHGLIQTSETGSPPDTFVNDVDSAVSLPSNKNLIVGFKHPFDVLDGQPSGEQFSQIDSISGSVATVKNNPYIRRLRASVDRFFLANGFDFGAKDSMVVVVDKDLSDKTFVVPMYRRITTNTTQPLSASAFNAYDTDAGPTGNLSTSFGSTYSFDDFKVHMRAKRVLDQASAQDALLFRAAQWGVGGEKIRVGYFYPTFPNQDISHAIVSEEEMLIRIFLKSGPVVVTAIDGTTEWNVTITANTPVAGVDQVTYTWSGTGTNPNLAALAGGEYVTISTDTGFNVLNTGTFRVSTEAGFLPSATSFTVVRENGAAIAETSAVTLVSGGISFYDAEPTTALDIETYIAANLTDVVTAEIVNDGGTTGSGVIEFSTAEFTDFADETLPLLDGENWIASTSLSSSPQLTFKKNLAYTSDTGYAFNDGEELRISPVTARHIADFINTLSVSGLSTAAEIQSVDHDKKIQISSLTLGSAGAIQVSGGAGSVISGQVVSSPVVIGDRTMAKVAVDRSTGSQLQGGQWIKFSASNKQSKLAGINQLTEARIVPNLPVAGKTTIELDGQRDQDLFFGYPRPSPRIIGRSWRIEKQGDLAVLAYAGSGGSPLLSRAAALNDSAGGNVNITKLDNGDIQYRIASGATRFTELSIGDRVTIQNMVDVENNGTFEISGLGDNGSSITVINPSGKTGVVSATITLTNNSNLSGDSFTVNGTTKTEGVEWSVGGSLALTAISLASALSSITGVTATPVGATVTVEMNSQESDISISYTDGGTSGATLSSSTLLGETFVAGDFSSTIQVKEGDSFIVDSPFGPLNQGLYRVVRRYGDSVFFDNQNAVEETVSDPSTAIVLSFDATTQLQISVSNGMKIAWTGVGTDPELELIKTGDILDLGSDFASANQGQYTVSAVREAEAEITKFTLPPASSISTGNHFLLSAAEDSTLYYVWFNVNGGGGDPLVVGRTGIQVAISSANTATQVAVATAAAIDAVLNFSATSSGAVVTVVNSSVGPATTATNVSVTGLSIEEYQPGHYSYVVSMNPSATAQTVTLSGSAGPDVYRPSIKFYPYEAAVAGDKISISGDILDANNAGQHTIYEILGPNRVIVNGVLDPVEFVVLGSSSDDLSVEEGVAFTAYKQIEYVSQTPGDLDNTDIIVNSREVAEKITTDGVTSVSGLSRMNFSTKVQVGQDSYRYDTGLLAEVNRIIFGDPRDTFTYPGVGAAGVDIYADPPLVRRVQVGIVVRIRTGIPFVQVVEQVRNSVSALISAQPIGQSLAISGIVAAVNEIPGVFAVSISSPQYDSTNDVIAIAQDEKALVIDPVTDITVSEN